MCRPARSSVAVLAVAGLASAVFTVGVGVAGYFLRASVGFTFGVALAAYFVWYEGHRNAARVVGFVCACTAAFPAALRSVGPLMAVFGIEAATESGRVKIPMSAFFAGGCVGALIVLAAGVFLLGPQKNIGRSIGMIALWSLGGGFLGVIGAAVDVIRTDSVGGSMYPLFIVWQPGVAALLGLLLEQERRSVAEPLATEP